MTKGIIFFTDNQLNLKIAHIVQKQLSSISIGKKIPIVSCSLKKMKFGTKNIYFPHLKRGFLTMFKQILGGLENTDRDIIFFCEHDVLYHPTHFDFIPPENNVYYYNTNVWKLMLPDGFAFKYDNCRQVSGLCGYRELLTGHYKRRIAKIEQNQRDLAAMGLEIKNEGMSKHMGFEPGLHMKPRGVDEYRADTWQSPLPNIDIRHGRNLSRTRNHPSQFHKQDVITGWQETTIDKIPGWKNLNIII